MATTPGWTSLGAFQSSGWQGERLMFGPASRNGAGLILTDRITFVRSGSDAFRILVEGRLENGSSSRWTTCCSPAFPARGHAAAPAAKGSRRALLPAPPRRRYPVPPAHRTR